MQSLANPLSRCIGQGIFTMSRHQVHALQDIIAGLGVDVVGEQVSENTRRVMAAITAVALGHPSQWCQPAPHDSDTGEYREIEVR